MTYNAVLIMASQSFIERFKDKSTKVNKWGNLNVESKYAVKQDITQGSPVQKSAKIILKNQQQTPSAIPASIALQDKLDRLNFSVLSTQSSPQSPRQDYSLNLKQTQRSPVVNKYSSGIYALHIKDTVFIPPIKPEDLPTRLASHSVDEMRERLEHSRNNSAKCEEFVPYTLEDYSGLNRNIELGGLGSGIIGSSEWKRRKESLDRRLRYGKYTMQNIKLNGSTKVAEVMNSSEGKYSKRHPQSVSY